MLIADQYPIPYSVWNFANAHTLVIVTTNVSPGTSSDQAGGSDQIVDLEIIDGSHAGSKYLSKKVRTHLRLYRSLAVGLILSTSSNSGHQRRNAYGYHNARVCRCWGLLDQQAQFG